MAFRNSSKNGVSVEESNMDDVSSASHIKIGSEEHRGVSESTVDEDTRWE